MLHTSLLPSATLVLFSPLCLKEYGDVLERSPALWSCMCKAEELTHLYDGHIPIFLHARAAQEAQLFERVSQAQKCHCPENQGLFKWHLKDFENFAG